MAQGLSEQDRAVWRNLADSYDAYLAARGDFFEEGVDQATLLHTAIRSVDDTAAAVALLPRLDLPQLTLLFDDLVFLSLSQRYAFVARDLIASLPREWVIARIEEAVEAHLRGGTYDEYRMMLGLYLGFDHALTRRLARRAAAHDDEDIREAGEEFLAKLAEASAVRS